MESVKTPKGTSLPLVNLKGKFYLMIAYRIQWLNEEQPNFNIETTILRFDKDESVVQAKVSLLDKEGKLVKSTSATKREDSKGFGDHLEKAETGAIGRALALLGYGTQFALADLDEGERIVDSPLQSAKPQTNGYKSNYTPQVAKTEPVSTNQAHNQLNQTTLVNGITSKNQQTVQGWD